MRGIPVGDLTGNKFGRWTVVRMLDERIRKQTSCLCRCECGNESRVIATRMRNGTSRSCGCLNIEIVKSAKSTHGLSSTNLFGTWANLKDRCLNSESRSYKNYGGRCITVCDEWIESSQNFMEWALSNGYAKGLSLDRINNDGPYAPENCRWTTARAQLNNRRGNIIIEFRGISQTIAQWEQQLGFKTSVLHQRIRRAKWSIERALTEPVRRRKSA
jgi:hypothetical protein